MGLLDASYSAVNTKKPRKSDRILPGEELNARGLLDAATNVPIAGDALSGVLAAYDAAKGDYSSAAANALGVLPFLSAGMIKAKTPFTFIRNTAKSPNMGETFGQHIEPAGRYMLEDTSNVASKLPDGWISGKHTFNNPLMIDWGKGGYADADNWKNVLSEKYGGKKGKQLSKAITKDGYDGIVTLRDGETSEVVDLSSFIKQPAKSGLLDDVRPMTEYEKRHEIARQNAVKMLGLPESNTAMDRARAMGFDTPAYHYTPYDFNEFKPHHYRGASFFADTPEGAAKGASAGNGEMQFVKTNPDHGGQIMPVLIGGKTYGEANYPDWFIPEIKKYGEYRALVDGDVEFGKIPIEGLSANQEKYINKMRLEAIKKPGSILEGAPESEWSKYPVVTNKNGNLDTHPDFPVVKGVASSKTTNGFAPVDYKGFEGFGYDPWAYQPTLTREEYRDTLQKLGFDSARVADESGQAIAVMNPNVVRSRFAAFDPARINEPDMMGYADPRLLGLIGGGGLLGLGSYKANQE